MKEKLEKLLQWPQVVHARQAFTRFGTRLGPQFAAAVTYFSVLSLVPILMFSFAMLGMTLTVLRPDLLDNVQATIHAVLSGAPQDLREMISGVVTSALNDWRGISVFALLAGGYSGSGWVGNLKRAVRMMWRQDPVDEERKANPVVEVVTNIVIFLGLLVCLLVGILVTQAGSSASSLILGWLDIGHLPGIGLLVRLISILLTFAASWLLVAFLFLALPDRAERASRRTWIVGVTIGAVLITILQQLAGTLIGVFSGNAAASLFGPIIVLMLLMNLLATIILMMAAWIGTDASARTEASAEQALASEMAAARSAVALAFAGASQEPTEMVRAEVAERGVRTGLGIGYATGAATGAGVGALLAGLVALVARLLGRR